MMFRKRLAVVASLLAMVLVSLTSVAQIPLAPPSTKGQTVTPAFEGWYRNPDGTYSLSFGYFNRNFEEVLEIPVGPDNFFEPGPANRGQPTHFQPRRHWGVFAITVPADFGYERLVWTLKIHGKTYFVPGSLNRDWEIDALRGEAGSGNTPPSISFHSGGPQGSGPAGVTGEPLTVAAGTPLAVTVWASDDGSSAGSVTESGHQGLPVTLTWFKHQGPGEVNFSEVMHKVRHTGGEAKTMVTFSEPGHYVLRVRANDASAISGDGSLNVANAGYAQCCWTNGFVTVNVTR
jgi:hypothetical protein